MKRQFLPFISSFAVGWFLFPASVPGQAAAGLSAPDNYSVTLLARNLEFPTALAFSQDRVWVAEAGLPGLGLAPTIKEVKGDGSTVLILSAAHLPPGVFEGPVTDLAFQHGLLWVAHMRTGGQPAISKFHPDRPAGTFITVSTKARGVALDKRISVTRNLLANRLGVSTATLSERVARKPIDARLRGDTLWVLDFGVYEPSVRLAQLGTGRLLLVQSGITTLPRTISGAPLPNQPPQFVLDVKPGRDEERPIVGTSVIPPFTRPGTISGSAPPNRAPAVVSNVVGGKDEERPIFGTSVIPPLVRTGTVNGAPPPDQPPTGVTDIVAGVDNERFVIGTSIPPIFTRPGTIRSLQTPTQVPIPVTSVANKPDATLTKQELEAITSRSQLESIPKQEQGDFLPFNISETAPKQELWKSYKRIAPK